MSLLGAAASGCGARTGLGAPIVVDATEDHHDAGHDAPDVVDAADAVEDDAVAFPDVPIVTSCAEAGVTYVYLITEQNELFSFYPPTLAFTKIGDIACPTSQRPFSMGVDRSGVAYSVFQDGHLFRISTVNAACEATTFAPNQDGFLTFGMGYSGADDAGETLYVTAAGTAPELGWIDTQSYVLSPIGSFKPSTGTRCELTGTGDGRLFAFCLPPETAGGEVIELDPATAQMLSDTPAPVAGFGDAFAWAFWGGEFWMFTGPGGGSTSVTRWDPQTKTGTVVASFASTVVGAGVSTCAPE